MCVCVCVCVCVWVCGCVWVPAPSPWFPLVRVSADLLGPAIVVGKEVEEECVCDRVGRQNQYCFFKIKMLAYVMNLVQ